MTYRELLIFPRPLHGRLIRGLEARTIVGGACKNFPVNPLLFHRGEDGHPLKVEVDLGAELGSYGAAPEIVFASARGAIRIIGVGAGGVRLLDEAAPLILTAMGAQYGPCEHKLRSGTLGIDPGVTTIYRVDSVGLTKKFPKIDSLAGPDGKVTLERAAPMISRALQASLLTQARLVDQAGGPRMEGLIPTSDALGLMLFSGNPSIRSISPHVHKNALFVDRLVLAMNIRLRGPWFFGLLRTHGLSELVRVQDDGGTHV